jgi:hypothetical protein
MCGPTHRITNCSQCSHVFRCSSPSAPSGRTKSCLHAFKLGTFARHIYTCCKVPPPLPLHSVVCPLPFYTCGRNAHVLTKAKRFHCQGMLHGILGGDSHEFVYGIRVAISVELNSVLFYSLRHFKCIVVSFLDPLHH